MAIKFDETVKNLMYNHLGVLVVFLVLYSILFYSNRDKHFGKGDSAPKNLIDILYFTTTTQSTTGYGDITVKSSLGRLINSAHHICVILLGIQLIFIIFKTVNK